jgi:uncharacterized protein
LKHNIQFIIPFSGLKEGEHEFEFQVNKAFFEEQENHDILDGKVLVHVGLFKKPNHLEMDFELEGIVHLACDRCLDPLEFDLYHTDRLIVKFGEEELDLAEGIIVIPETEHELDITWYVNECILLGLPMRKCHEEGECNKEMMKLYKKLGIKDKKQSKQKDTDPRWDGLKDLLSNN